MARRFAEMEPVPRERINAFNDGDVFDLGDGVRLRGVFTPGHQPGGHGDSWRRSTKGSSSTTWSATASPTVTSSWC